MHASQSTQGGALAFRWQLDCSSVTFLRQSSLPKEPSLCGCVSSVMVFSSFYPATYNLYLGHLHISLSGLNCYCICVVFFPTQLMVNHLNKKRFTFNLLDLHCIKKENVPK